MSLSPSIGSFQFVQASASTNWTITHNLNTINPIVDCWVDDNGTQLKITPTAVVGTSNSICTITFNTAQAGNALVI